MADLICPSCSCLCDDIRLKVEEGRLTGVDSACLKGASYFQAVAGQRERPCLVAGKPVPAQEAIAAAAALLAKARHPMIFGLDNSPTEAQLVAFKLARALGAVLDDTSSFCQGGLTEKIIRGVLPGCPLSDASRIADVLIYWGANPYQAHPRHLSKFTFYPRAEYKEAGWTPAVTLVGVDIRETETTIICHRFYTLPPGGDRDFIGQVITGLGGGETAPPAAELSQLLSEARYVIFFAGLGLVYSLDNDLSPFEALVGEVRKRAKVAVLPMVGHFNTMGFNHTCFDETGFVNQVSFANGVTHGAEFSILEQVRQRQPDCLLVVGSDPFTSLPRPLVRHLSTIPIICLDPFPTPTCEAAQVAIGVAPAAVEVSGTARRMDGETVALTPAWPARSPSDEEVLRGILEQISR